MGYVARMYGVVVERRPSLPWTRSTLRLPQGQHCTSRDHEEGPCNEHSTQISPYMMWDTWTRPAVPQFIVPNREFQRQESPRLNRWETSMNSNSHVYAAVAAVCGCVQTHTLGARRVTRMPTVVGVIVSWLEHEVIVTALKFFYASFYRPAWWEMRACRQTTMAGARPATLSEAAQTHNLERCRGRQICRRGGGLHLTALTMCFPRIQRVAPPCFTVCRTQLVQV